MKTLYTFAMAAFLGVAGFAGEAYAVRPPPVVRVPQTGLGISLRDNADGLGAYVTEVRDGPFFTAGLEVGDIIVAINGTVLATAADFYTQIVGIASGTKFQLRVKDV